MSNVVNENIDFFNSPVDKFWLQKFLSPPAHGLPYYLFSCFILSLFFNRLSNLKLPLFFIYVSVPGLQMCFGFLMLVVSWWQRDRAAWLMRPKDCFVDTVADNLLDRLEVVISIFII